MRKPRWITWDNREWRLNELAREYHIAVGTLAARLNRLPVERALATGIATRSAAGQRGKSVSPWTRQLHHREKENGAT